MRRVLFLLTIACACSQSASQSGAPGACAEYQALVAASDYSSSAVGAIGVAGAEQMRSAGDLGSDPALTTSSGRAFYISRLTDTVFELDARCGTALSSFSVADPAKRPANPQDLAVASDGSLWIARYNVPTLLVHAASGDATIDLSKYDGDGNPNASSIRIVGGKAFVTLERLDDADMYKSKQPSLVLRIDVATRAVEAHIELAGRNPFGLAVEQDGAMWLAEPGNFDDADEPLAGVERFDTASSTSRLVVREHDLGGSVAEVAVDASCAAAIVADATPNVNATQLVTFDPATGAILARGVLATAGFDLEGIAFVSDPSGGRVLLAGDRRQSGGGYAVHVFDVGDGCALRERARPVLVPQKPVAIRPVAK